jgi:formylglycine-generating enzyme required for sulfatase activity
LTQQKEGAGEQSFKFWNHPHETVSWYDAMAFCAWLTARLKLLSGIVIRLPTDDEWEAAARGKDERRYPYLGEYDPAKGNTDDTGIGQTSVVGVFPDGVSPSGALDMSGNVFDWTLTEYGRKSNNINTNEVRTLRGGSWGSYRVFARAAYRIDCAPNLRGVSIGFRVALGEVVAFSE